MSVNSGLKLRRSIYALNKELEISESEVVRFIEETVELVPDAFNMKSQRVVVALGERQNRLWDEISAVFDGKVPQEKIDGFKGAYGTVLYFYDKEVVNGLMEKFPAYAQNFPNWAQQSNGMLQISIWAGLRDLGIGANLQHYNPVIDNVVKEMFDIPESYVLLAQMPFGGIVSEPEAKEKEDIAARVKVVK